MITVFFLLLQSDFHCLSIQGWQSSACTWCSVYMLPEAVYNKVPITTVRYFETVQCHCSAALPVLPRAIRAVSSTHLEVTRQPQGTGPFALSTRRGNWEPSRCWRPGKGPCRLDAALARAAAAWPPCEQLPRPAELCSQGAASWGSTTGANTEPGPWRVLQARVGNNSSWCLPLKRCFE